MEATRTNGGADLAPCPSASPPLGTPRLGLRGLTRRFGPVVANEGVDLTVLPGEVHALLGENGAGKSTLVKAIYGAIQPDEGTILWEGRPVRVPGPRAARRLGIGVVHQHFALFAALTVLENVALGLDRPGPLPRLAAEIEALGARYGLPLDPARPVHALSVGERQRVEVLRCLLQRPRLFCVRRRHARARALMCDDPQPGFTRRAWRSASVPPYASGRRLFGRGRLFRGFHADIPLVQEGSLVQRRCNAAPGLKHVCAKRVLFAPWQRERSTGFGRR